MAPTKRQLVEALHGPRPAVWTDQIVRSMQPNPLDDAQVLDDSEIEPQFDTAADAIAVTAVYTRWETPCHVAPNRGFFPTRLRRNARRPVGLREARKRSF